MGSFEMRTPLRPLAMALRSAFNTFTTRQDIIGAPWPAAYPIDLEVGSMFDFEAEGEASSTGTPNLTLGFYLATTAGTIATVIAETAATAIATGAAWPWRLQGRAIVKTPGSSGAMQFMGQSNFPTSLTAWTSAPMPLTAAGRSVTFSTIVPTFFGVCGTWSASSASNNVQVYRFNVDKIN